MTHASVGDTAGAWRHLAFRGDSISFVWPIAARWELLVRDNRKGHRVRSNMDCLNHQGGKLPRIIASALSSGTLAHRVLMVLRAGFAGKGIDQ